MLSEANFERMAPAQFRIYSRVLALYEEYLPLFEQKYREHWEDNDVEMPAYISLDSDKRFPLELSSVGCDAVEVWFIEAYKMQAAGVRDDTADVLAHDLISINVRLFNDNSPYVREGDNPEDGTVDASMYLILLGREFPPMVIQSNFFDGGWATPEGLEAANKYILSDELITSSKILIKKDRLGPVKQLTLFRSMHSPVLAHACGIVIRWYYLVLCQPKQLFVHLTPKYG